MRSIIFLFTAAIDDKDDRKETVDRIASPKGRYTVTIDKAEFWKGVMGLDLDLPLFYRNPVSATWALKKCVKGR